MKLNENKKQSFEYQMMFCDCVHIGKDRANMFWNEEKENISLSLSLYLVCVYLCMYTRGSFVRVCVNSDECISRTN